MGYQPAAKYTSHLLGSSSSKESPGCCCCSSDTCPASALRTERFLGPAGRYKDREYRYKLAAATTVISPTNERMFP